jgi:outer membrane receptor protein involved in Fe transport
MKRDFYTDILRPDFRTQAKLDLGDPAWAGSLWLTPSWRNFELTWRMQYIGKMTVATFETMNSVDGRPPTNPDAFPFTFYDDAFYHDLQFQVTIADQFRIYAGIDNITNKQPPFGLLGDGAGSAVYPNSGRFLYIGADLRFGGTRRGLAEALGRR